LYLSTFGIFDTQVIDAVGPNVRIATCDHIHSRPGVLGGVLANDILKLPIIHWNWALPPDVERAGLAGKTAMRELYRRTGHVNGPIQEIPSPSNRVSLSREVRDGQGVPVARLSGRPPDLVPAILPRRSGWPASGGNVPDGERSGQLCYGPMGTRARP
jgi:hypothetical protein